MDYQTLKRHRYNLKELKRVEGKIAELEGRLEEVPTVSGKVEASTKDFPYILSHVPVSMAEPGESDRIKKQIFKKELYRQQVYDRILSVETFLADMEEGTLKTICEMVADGMKQEKIAEEIGYTQARVSQLLKDL